MLQLHDWIGHYNSTHSQATHVLQIFNLFVVSLEGTCKAHTPGVQTDAYIARAFSLLVMTHEEQVAEVIEITHVKEYHDEGERVA